MSAPIRSLSVMSPRLCDSVGLMIGNLLRPSVLKPAMPPAEIGVYVCISKEVKA
jgi:hypothetical protein